MEANENRLPNAATSLFDATPEADVRLAAGIEFLRERDPALRKFIDRVGRCELRTQGLHDPFNALVRSIIFQQLSGRAAETIYRRTLAALTSNETLAPSDVLDADLSVLRGAGVSGNKAAALRDLAARAADGTVPTLERLAEMDDEEIIERLTSVRGVGRWTVEMLLMFRLGRPDVLPATDLAIRKGAGLIDGLAEMPTPKQTLARGEVWRPLRTIASWYLYRSLDLPPEDGTNTNKMPNFVPIL